MTRSPPFRADTVGSLLRPKRLLDPREPQTQPVKFRLAKLQAIEDEEIQRAVDLQKAVGLKCCTDGDFRRRHWFMDFIERIDGLRFAEPLPVRFKSADGSVEFSPPSMELYAPLQANEKPDRHRLCRGEAGRRHRRPAREAADPSPTLLHFRSTRSRMHSTIYPDVDQLYEDIAQVYREECAALYAAGCRYLQIDETNIPGHLSRPRAPRPGQE